MTLEGLNGNVRVEALGAKGKDSWALIFGVFAESQIVGEGTRRGCTSAGLHCRLHIRAEAEVRNDLMP